MPFVLRQENDTENPTLAVPYGLQITAGKMAYYIKENGRNKCIIFLGEGEMDGINKLLFRGEEIPEFNGTERNWKFHPGTLTKQAIFKTISSFNTSDSTITVTGNTYMVGQEVALMPQLDAVLPNTLQPNTKYYVVSSVGNLIKLSATAGGTPITIPAGATGNHRIYRANAGYFDPIQGRPDFFPTIDYTFSGIAYVEVHLSTAMTEAEEEPTNFKIFVRGKRVWNYNAFGDKCDEQNIPFVKGSERKIFSANNALVALDILTTYMKLGTDRIDFPSFAKYKEHCNVKINWNSGNIPISANPSWTFTNITENPIGILKKTVATDGWNASGVSTQTIPEISQSDMSVSFIYRGGHLAVGLTRSTNPTTFSDNFYAIHPSTLENKLLVMQGATRIYEGGIGGFSIGDRFKIEVDGNVVNFYQNDNSFHRVEGSTIQSTTDIRAMVALYSANSFVEDLRMYPIKNQSRNVTRFDAHIVYPQEMAGVVALEQVFARSPGCHWQDVGGKIKVVVGSTYKEITDVTLSAGDRVLVGQLSYDPTQTIIKSNIVENSFSSFRKPSEEKSNFLRMEVRDLDDPYFTKKYVYGERPLLKDKVGVVDPGIIPVGVAHQSLADRIAEATLRFGSDLDLFVQVQGQANTFAFAKGDIVRFSHDVPDWKLDQAPIFLVLEETFESGTESADDRSFLLQIYNPEFYSDTAHGAITGSFPVPVSSSLTPPPALSSLDLSEGNRILPDGTNVPTIKGVINFDSSYNNRQRARVYWKRPTDLFYTNTNIVIEQTDVSMNSIPFELNFAPFGVNEVRVVTESMLGVVSNSTIDEVIEVVGVTQTEVVEWEQFINTESISGFLTKTTGVYAWDATAVSTKAIHNGNGHMQFVLNTLDSAFALGLNCYNYTNSGLSMKFGFEINTTISIKTILNGTTFTHSETPMLGDGFKLEIRDGVIYYYLIRNNTSILLREETFTNLYPLYVDSSIYTPGASIPTPEIYGALERTTGYPLHWTKVVGTIFNQNEVITKTAPTGWIYPQAAGMYSIEYLSSNGALEFEATETTTYRIIGLSSVMVDITQPNQPAYTHQKYAIYLRGGGEAGTFEIRENHTGTQVSVYTGAYATGDIFRIERTNGIIKYRKNGVLLYTSLVSSVDNLYVDMGFYDNGATVKNVRIKKVGIFTPGNYPYPIYWIENLRVEESRPQEDGQVFFQLAATFPRSDLANILRAKVRVYDKFGVEVYDFPPFTYTGNGILATGYHARKYADPLEEAIYKIQVDNGFGYSDPVYLKTGISSFVMPALVNIDTIPKDLTATPIDHNKVSLSWTFTGNVDIYRRMQNSSWTLVVEDMESTAPYVSDNLSPDTIYEYKVCNTGTTLFSNIARTKTLQAPLPVDTYPAPTNLVCTLNGTDPTTKVDLVWVRNATGNTGVEVYRDGVLINTLGATETTYTDIGRTPGSTYIYKVRNVFNLAGNSIYSNECPAIMATAQSPQRPTGLNGRSVGYSRIDLFWTNNGATGTNRVQISQDGENDWADVSPPLSNTTSSWSLTGLGEGEGGYFRVYNTSAMGYSNVILEYTDEIIFNCVTPVTYIWMADGSRKKAKFIKPYDEIMSVGLGGVLSTTVVKKVHVGTSDTLNILTTKDGYILECTPSHPIISNKDMNIVRAISITKGDTVLGYNDILDKIEETVIYSKETLDGQFEVMIFELEDKEHTFISNNIVSHNIDNKY